MLSADELHDLLREERRRVRELGAIVQSLTDSLADAQEARRAAVSRALAWELTPPTPYLTITLKLDPLMLAYSHDSKYALQHLMGDATNALWEKVKRGGRDAE